MSDYVYLKNLQGQQIKPVTDLAAINMTTTNGIAVEQVNGGTIGIRDGYIESCYYAEMVDPGVGAANVDSAYIEGGTMFTLIGGYTVSDEIPPAADADPYKIPSELSVRSAIDALATLGPSFTPGAGIVVTTVPGSTGGILSVAEGNGVEVNTAQQGGVSVKAGAGISVDSNGVSVVTATNNTLGGIAGATNGVTLVDGVAQVDAGDGLLIDSGKVVIDEASVETTLQDVRIDEGSTVSPVDDQVLTPGNLRGALSVGQAVDVSVPCRTGNGSIYFDGDSTAYTVNSTVYKNNYMKPITYSAASLAYPSNIFLGWSTNTEFQKKAPGLRYLIVCDVMNTGNQTLTLNGNSGLVGGDVVKVKNVARTWKDLAAAGGTENEPHQTKWSRLAAIFSGDVGKVWLQFQAATGTATDTTCKICNMREYEVTNLTDDAISYLAKYGADADNPKSPDDFFRNADIRSDTATTNPHPSILSRYLVKQDMVAPWIPTINMPDNSAGLTVGAGLSYKIKYTQTGTYSVSVDTIPTDAYGWDAHIQMFVKDTAIVQFQTPLILMDALTPNAGHNLSVKFRNGNALVYVDDTNAGTMVYLATGTTTDVGSLPYALSQTPPSEDATFTNFVVFSPVLGGTVCSMGNMSNVAYSASLIGNGDDSTIVGGTIGMASGKYLAVQDVNLKDFAITSGSLNIGNNVKVTGTTTAGVTGSGTGSIVLDESCLLDFSDQANNIPITGASISAVSGARAIPYGETESEAIAAGTGNAVNKYGKCGYLVSVASGTATNTLYDALVGGGTAYSNIIFDPALDGQTVSYNGAITFLPNISTRPTFIVDGNGIDNTIVSATINCAPTSGDALYVVYTYKNMTLTNFTYTYHRFSRFENVKFSGYIDILAQSGAGTSHPITIINSVIDGVANNNAIVSSGNACIKIINCQFKNNVAGSSYQIINVAGNATYPGHLLIENCHFFNSNTCKAFDSGSGYGDVSIKDSIFEANNDIVINAGTVTFSGTNILDSTISGAGIVVFADGATVTSTIPDGSTIGTGVISAKFAKSVRANSCTIENVSISGSTATGSLLAVGEGANVTLKNCVFANNALDYHDAPSGDQPYLIYLTNQRSIAHLNNVTITSDNYAMYGYNSGRTVYAIVGLLYVTDCYFDTASGQNSYNGVLSYKGTVVFSGDNTTRINVSTASGVDTKYVITPNTIIRTDQESIGGYAGTIIYVGTYNENTGTVTTTGTATVVLKGTTVTISGSGTTIDSTGLHS